MKSEEATLLTLSYRCPANPVKGANTTSPIRLGFSSPLLLSLLKYNVENETNEFILNVLRHARKMVALTRSPHFFDLGPACASNWQPERMKVIYRISDS